MRVYHKKLFSSVCFFSDSHLHEPCSGKHFNNEDDKLWWQVRFYSPKVDLIPLSSLKNPASHRKVNPNSGKFNLFQD